MNTRLARRRGLPLVGLLSLLSAAWWLWGDDAPQYLGAMGNRARAWLIGEPSPELRKEVVDKELVVASAETNKVAVLVAKLDSEIKSVDQAIERVLKAQKADEVTLARLKEHLGRLKPGDVVVINEKSFAREDIANDAAVILDRYRARTGEIDDLRAHRADLVQTRDELRAEFRQRCDRIRTVALGQKRIGHLIDQQRFETSLAAVKAPERTDRFGRLEENQRSLMAELSAARAMSGPTPSSPTPSADAIGAQEKPDIEAEIAKVLSGEKVAKR